MSQPVLRLRVKDDCFGHKDPPQNFGEKEAKIGYPRACHVIKFISKALKQRIALILTNIVVILTIIV